MIRPLLINVVFETMHLGRSPLHSRRVVGLPEPQTDDENFRAIDTVVESISKSSYMITRWDHA